MYDGLDELLFFDKVNLSELQALRDLLDGPTSAEPSVATRGQLRQQPQQPTQPQREPQPQRERQRQPEQQQQQQQLQPQPQLQPRQQAQPQAQPQVQQAQKPQKPKQQQQPKPPPQPQQKQPETHPHHRQPQPQPQQQPQPQPKQTQTPSQSRTSQRDSSTSKPSSANVDRIRADTSERSSRPVQISSTINPRQITPLPKQFARRSTPFVPAATQAREIVQSALLKVKQFARKSTGPYIPPPKKPNEDAKTPKKKSRPPSPRRESPPIPRVSEPQPEPIGGDPEPKPTEEQAESILAEELSELSPAEEQSELSPAEEQSVSTPAGKESISTQAEEDSISTPTELDEENVDELPITYDRYGLPSNLDERFHRWLYGDMTAFQMNGVKKKRPEDEVKPPPVEPKKNTTCCNEVDTDHGFKFITQDIDLDEPLPIEEILTPSLRLKASSSLAATANSDTRQADNTNCQADTNQQSTSQATDSEPPAKKRKPRLTITLEVHRTIIDRRPMLRKMKSKPQPVVSQIDGPGEQVSSTSLIAPGEDCDDSDDNDVIEIDCDEPSSNSVIAQ